jgi:hypothetical protein
MHLVVAKAVFFSNSNADLLREKKTISWLAYKLCRTEPRCQCPRTDVLDACSTAALDLGNSGVARRQSLGSTNKGQRRKTTYTAFSQAMNNGCSLASRRRGSFDPSQIGSVNEETV